jgi:uncharacterized protein YbjT (DUF2867 family)
MLKILIMKIIVTGSLGHISKPLTQELLQNGHTVTVISSSPQKQKEIEELGASAAIGSLEDVDFLTSTFNGSDAVYSMIPPNNYFDHTLDLAAYCLRLAHNYVVALRNSGVKRLVHLSSIGAHMEKDSGLILPHHQAEIILGQLSETDITFMRPTSFYYNLYGYVPQIKALGVITCNYGGDDLIPFVSPLDIAAAIVEELELQPARRKVRYVASDERTGTETAQILGAAIGMPDLQWQVVSDQEALEELITIGMNPEIAKGLVEMYAGIHNGKLVEDYLRNPPSVMGKVKLTEYAKEFTSAF